MCAKCKAINGFEHIQVIGKREKVHISRRHDKQTASNVQIDADYFNGKRVLLIDDICTTCTTANAFIEQMQKAGADVRMTLFLAKTKSYRRFEHPRPTGKQRTPSFARLSTNGALGSQRDKKMTAATDGL